ncbi:hypothetical protein [Caldithrix abyssi]
MVRILIISTLSMPVIVLAIVGAIFLINPPQPAPAPAPVPQLSEKEKRIEIKAHVMQDFRNKRWGELRHTLDSLFTVIDLLNDSLKRKEAIIDTLNQKMVFYQNDYQNLEKQIADLKKKLGQAKEEEKKIKDLAKTLSGLKGKSLARIVAKMDDRTVIKIYSQMSNTSKRTLMSSLPAERAAVIAQKIIKN